MESIETHKGQKLKYAKDFQISQGAPRFELGTYRSAVDCSTTELYTQERQTACVMLLERMLLYIFASLRGMGV